MPDYSPYVNGYGGIPKLFAEIKSAAVPPKFTQDFMSTLLGLKSSSYRAMIPLLKKLGFIDQANVPTQAYKDYRDEAQSRPVMARQLHEAYAPLFEAHEYAYRLNKKELQSKLRTITGAAEDDANIGYIAATFLELSKLASWDGAASVSKREDAKPPANGPPLGEREDTSRHEGAFKGRLGLSYTINLNLPATTEIEVFNAIFKSLRNNLLGEQ